MGVGVYRGVTIKTFSHSLSNRTTSRVPQWIVVLQVFIGVSRKEVFTDFEENFCSPFYESRKSRSHFIRDQSQEDKGRKEKEKS